jgi:hypothetical protein
MALAAVPETVEIIDVDVQVRDTVLRAVASSSD